MILPEGGIMLGWVGPGIFCGEERGMACGALSCPLWGIRSGSRGKHNSDCEQRGAEMREVGFESALYHIVKQTPLRVKALIALIVFVK